MAEVRGDSLISITDPTGKITTVIAEEDYERGEYKANGWKVNSHDWTKDREVREPVDNSIETSTENLGKGAKV